jgi:hypothetical protein
VKLLLKVEVSTAASDMGIAQELLEAATGERLQKVKKMAQKASSARSTVDASMFTTCPNSRTGASEVFALGSSAIAVAQSNSNSS